MMIKHNIRNKLKKGLLSLSIISLAQYSYGINNIKVNQITEEQKISSEISTSISKIKENKELKTKNVKEYYEPSSSETNGNYSSFEQSSPLPGEEKPLVYPKINYGFGKEAEQIKRGEYLVKASDCIACHSKPGGKVFAGSLPMATPFGIYYSSNITPSKKYGIGNWSEEDFIKAMRTGTRPDGKNLFPVFPYIYFAKMNDQELKDIKKYLDALPAVDEEPPENDVPWPFNWRLPISFWKLAFFKLHSEPFIYNKQQSPQWNRGAYLVEGPAHCGMCHTPLNLAGAPKRKYAYTGGNIIDNFYVPGITSEHLKNYTVDEIIRVFKEDRKLGGRGKVRGPMAQANHDSLRYLSEYDLRAMVIYLKTVKSAIPQTKSYGKEGVEKLYTDKCASCHTSGAGGAPKIDDTNEWSSRSKKGKDKLYENAIQGIAGMPPKGTCVSCTDEEIKGTVDYMLNQLAKLANSKSNKPSSIRKPKLSIQDGEVIYNNSCSSCHDKGQSDVSPLSNSQEWQTRAEKGFDVLVKNTIKGYKNMPAKGSCTNCNNEEIIAAVKYMLKKSNPKRDFSLW